MNYQFIEKLQQEILELIEYGTLSERLIRIRQLAQLPASEVHALVCRRDAKVTPSNDGGDDLIFDSQAKRYTNGQIYAKGQRVQ